MNVITSREAYQSSMNSKRGRKIDCEVLNYAVSQTDYLRSISGCPLIQATETSYVVSDFLVSKEISYRGLTGTL
jgi:hypothetical protein